MATTEPAEQLRSLTVALVGNPNTGKSTLFNSLAGMRARVGNFPGVTVEKKTGRVTWDGRDIELIDLPGSYSLSPRSRDEMVSVDVLLGRQSDIDRPDVVVCIVDASNLERNLYLVSQVLDLGLPTVLVLNKVDIAHARGMTIDAASLSSRLGIPVVETEAHRKRGLEDVTLAILTAAEQQTSSSARLLPEAFYDECERLSGRLSGVNGHSIPLYLLERLILDIGGYAESQFTKEGHPELPHDLDETRSRLTESGCPVPAIEARVRYAWIRDLLSGIMVRRTDRVVTASDRIDRVLTHRFVGLGVFCLLMFIIFQAIYHWAEPLMDAVQFAQSWTGGLIEGLMPPGALRSLLIDGAIAGVGSVVIFLPQICLLFLFIALLEDCGYMARAAFLMDKLMTKVGLSGKSFVPLMSSFACAVPGVMAARVIENRRDRMVTILVAPLMSCSARLPVYLLLIGAFIPATPYLGGWITLPGLVLFGVSSLGAVIAVPMAWILKKTVFPGETPPFVMELPSYKWPSPRIVFHRVYDRGKAFLTRAGTLIFATTIVVWALGYFPGDHTELNRMQAEIESGVAATADGQQSANESTAELIRQKNALSGRLIASSYLGRAGRAIEPMVKPIGWDWKIGVGVLASFPAREVIIATLGTIYSLGGDVDEQNRGLIATLQEAKWPDGRAVYNVPVAVSIMVFFALCAQCASTLITIRRETNSWLWPGMTFSYMTILAYVAAWTTYRVGMLLVSRPF